MIMYYFWDHRGTNTEIPAYLQLCLQTWQLHAGADQIIEVSSKNIHQYTNNELDEAKLALFTPAQRSDAAMPHVLRHNSGIFIDADTIFLPHFNASKFYDPNKVMTIQMTGIGLTLAFLSRGENVQNNAFIDTWCAEIQRRIHVERFSAYRVIRRALRRLQGKEARVKWDYLGQPALDMAAAKNPSDMQIIALDQHTAFHAANPREFVKEWLVDDELHLDRHPDGMIGLYNSSVPKEYKALTKQQVLEHPYRLSRVLAHALQQPSKYAPKPVGTDSLEPA